VSSRTYFAARATSIVTQPIVLASITGYLPVVAFLARPDGSILQAAAAFLAVVGAALLATAGVVLLCSALLVSLQPQRASHAVVLLQSVGGIGFAVGLLLPVVLWLESRDVSTLASLPVSAWTLWFPPTWFASYVELARGSAAWQHVGAAGISILALAGCAVALSGRLSTAFAVRVMQAADTAPPRAVPSRPSPLRGAWRVAATLLRAELRNPSIQGAIAGDLVMALLIVGMLLWTGGMPADPFANSRGPIAVLMVFLLFPGSLLRTLTRNESFEASWFFFTTPTSPRALAMAARDVVAVASIGPLAVLVAAMLTWTFGHVGQALLFTAIGGLAGYVALLGSALYRPALPFSQPPMGQPGAGMAGAGGSLSLGSFLVGGPVLVAAMVLGRSALGAIAATAILVTVAVGLRLLAGKRSLRPVRGYADT
jgi:hypothetical protein